MRTRSARCKNATSDLVDTPFSAIQFCTATRLARWLVASRHSRKTPASRGGKSKYKMLSQPFLSHCCWIFWLQVVAGELWDGAISTSGSRQVVTCSGSGSKRSRHATHDGRPLYHSGHPLLPHVLPVLRHNLSFLLATTALACVYSQYALSTQDKCKQGHMIRTWTVANVTENRSCSIYS